MFEINFLTQKGIRSSDGAGRTIVNLPEIENVDSDDLFRRIKDGQALIGWFCLPAIGGDIDILWLYRVEYDLICSYYIGYSDIYQTPYLKLQHLRQMNRENFQKLYDEELQEYGHIYCDNDQKIVGITPAIAHDINVAEVFQHLKKHPVFNVSDDRFLKK